MSCRRAINRIDTNADGMACGGRRRAGEFVHRITGRYRERRVMTDFGPIGPRGQAEDVFILTG